MRVDCWIVASIKSIFDSIPLFDVFVCMYIFLPLLALVCVSRHVLNIQKWPVSKKYRKIWFYFGVFFKYTFELLLFLAVENYLVFSFECVRVIINRCSWSVFIFFARRFYFAVVLLLFGSSPFTLCIFSYFWYENQLLAIRNHYIWVNVCAECGVCVYIVYACLSLFYLLLHEWPFHLVYAYLSLYGFPWFSFKSVQFVQIDFLFSTISSRWMDETNGFLIVD